MAIRDQDLSTAAETADALQERLVRAAYGLHFACANMATLMQTRGETVRGPSPIDYATEVKRWRAASEQALGVVRAWDSAALPAAPTEFDADPGPASGVVGLADATIRELFGVAMHLQAVQPLAAGAVRARIADAVDLLDGVINRLRRAALSELQAGPTSHPDHDAD